MHIIAQQIIEGQYTVTLLDRGDGCKPRYQVRYGVEEKDFSGLGQAQRHYKGCRTHQQECAGWIN
ncbi:hypothetical protein bb8_p05 [Bordetella phage vB_BbrP_BB8]|uniref:Uncharacterized protein n=1 Tax=Bordetella phage vB_BbrP_BB8 TaxID=2587820 RepID=A0A4Y5TQW1_9CAUD|nr:hypothetical protein bb8_p05 [Bordetella phage vB_BbrP_BB8]